MTYGVGGALSFGGQWEIRAEFEAIVSAVTMPTCCRSAAYRF